MGKRVVVVGAGTEVGKTHAACILLRSLRRNQQKWRGIKPVESGIAPGKLRTDSDAARLAAACRRELSRPRYLFVDAISPHLAARRSHIDIELDEISGWVGSFGRRNLVIETAGGLMSPLGPSLTNLDLAERVSPDGLVLVAQDRLGALHDVASAMQLLRPRFTQLFHAGAVMVVLSAPPTPDASTTTNAGELVALKTASRVVTLPRADERSAESLEAGAELAEWCSDLAPGTLHGM